MKKLVFGFIGLAFIVGGCSSAREDREVRVIHEHYVYVINMNNAPGARFNRGRGFNQSKGIDPRYDHKPGQLKPGNRLNQSKGIDPRYDHRSGSARPTK